MTEAGARPRSVVAPATARSKWLASVPALRIVGAAAVNTCGDAAKAGGAAAARVGGNDAARVESAALRRKDRTAANEAKARMPESAVPAVNP